MKAQWIETGIDIIPAELATHGIINFTCPTDPSIYQQNLDRIKEIKGYVAQDEVNMSPTLPNYEEMSQKFRIEHYHPGDEVRFVLEGGGVWEIRSLEDKWMRVEVGPGDFIVVPDKRYHLFYLTDEKYIKCVRLFKDTNGWVQVYRRDVEAQGNI